MSRHVVTYFGDSTNDLEASISDLMTRAEILHVAIGYGPSPAKAAGLSPHGGDVWHALVIYEIGPQAQEGDRG